MQSHKPSRAPAAGSLGATACGMRSALTAVLCLTQRSSGTWSPRSSGGAAHALLKRQLAPAWALRGPQGWTALHAAASELREHELAVDAELGAGTFARGAGLLGQHLHTQARRRWLPALQGLGLPGCGGTWPCQPVGGRCIARSPWLPAAAGGWTGRRRGWARLCVQRCVARRGCLHVRLAWPVGSDRHAGPAGAGWQPHSSRACG